MFLSGLKNIGIMIVGILHGVIREVTGSIGFIIIEGIVNLLVWRFLRKVGYKRRERLIKESEWFPRSLIKPSGLRFRDQVKFGMDCNEDLESGMMEEEKVSLEKELESVEDNKVIWPMEIVGIFG
jgi:hypothetical protein